jgi:hypothetical protein
MFMDGGLSAASLMSVVQSHVPPHSPLILVFLRSPSRIQKFDILGRDNTLGIKLEIIDNGHFFEE